MDSNDVRKHINKLYQAVYKIVKNEFWAISSSIYEEVYDETLAVGYSGDLRTLNKTWLEKFFEDYNLVTKYVFNNEFDRKKSRLFESLLANMEERNQSYKTAENLLLRQIKQYIIELEDAIAMTVYSDLGVEFVKWNAEDDHRTCGVCNELDGQIFKLEDAPPKQHYQCRCWLTPVRE